MDSAGHRSLAARPRAEALQTYERIIQRRPSMAIGYRNLAFLQWQDGDARGAIATLERAFRAERHRARHDDTDWDRTWRRRDGRLTPSRCSSRSPRRRRHDPDALNALGIAYARRQRQTNARRDVPPRARENPSNVQALENIGTLEMQRGNLPAARKALEQAVAIDPTSARAHNGLGVVAMQTGAATRRSGTGSRRCSSRRAISTRCSTSAWSSTHAGRRDEARPFLERFAARPRAATVKARMSRE